MPARRQNHSTATWERHRPTMESMYIKEGLKLQEIITTMYKKFNFSATHRQYVHRFTRWGLRKNIPHDVMVSIALIRAERKQEGKGSVFTWHGQPVAKERLDGFVKREGLGVRLGDGGLRDKDKVAIPSGMRCQTPPSDITETAYEVPTIATETVWESHCLPDTNFMSLQNYKVLEEEVPFAYDAWQQDAEDKSVSIPTSLHLLHYTSENWGQYSIELMGSADQSTVPSESQRWALSQNNGHEDDKTTDFIQPSTSMYDYIRSSWVIYSANCDKVWQGETTEWNP